MLVYYLEYYCENMALILDREIKFVHLMESTTFVYNRVKGTTLRVYPNPQAKGSTLALLCKHSWPFFGYVFDVCYVIDKRKARHLTAFAVSDKVSIVFASPKSWTWSKNKVRGRERNKFNFEYFACLINTRPKHKLSSWNQ